MRRTHRSVVVIALGLFLFGAGVALAQDWPQWRGPNRDGKVSGFTAPEKWPSALAQKWQQKVGTGDATPALVGDKLYVFARQGDEEITLCLNVADGSEVWRSKYTAQAVAGAASRHPGPRGSPAVAEGKVVTLGVGGVLSCLDAASGKELWRKDEFPRVVPKFFAASSPLIVDGLAVAQLGGGEKGAVMAFDLASGNRKWQWPGEGPAYASPVLMTVGGTKMIVAQTEKSLVGLAVADGKLLWQVPTPLQGRANSCATPIVDGQTVIYTGQGSGTKAVKIEKQGDAFAAKPLWSGEIGTTFNTPVLKDGLLYGVSDRGNLYCMKAQNGEVAWTGADRVGNFGSIIDAGSALLLQTEKTGLIAFKPSDKGYEELAKIKVSDAPVYAHAFVAGKRVFVKDSDTVTVWMLE